MDTMDIPLPNVEPPKKDATPVDVAKEFQKQSQYIGEVADSVIQDAAQTAQSLGQTYDPAYMYGKYMNPVIGSVRSDIEQQGALMAGDKAITQAQEQAEERMKQAQENYKKAQQARAARIAAENERRAREAAAAANNRVEWQNGEAALSENQLKAKELDGKTKSIVDWIKRTPNWGDQIGDADAQKLGYANRDDIRKKTRYVKPVEKEYYPFDTSGIMGMNLPGQFRPNNPMFDLRGPKKTIIQYVNNEDKEYSRNAIIEQYNRKLKAVNDEMCYLDKPVNYGGTLVPKPIKQMAVTYPEEYKKILASANHAINNAFSVEKTIDTSTKVPQTVWKVRIPEAAIESHDAQRLKSLLENQQYINHKGEKVKVAEDKMAEHINQLVNNLTADYFAASALSVARNKTNADRPQLTTAMFDLATYKRSKNKKTVFRITGTTFEDIEKAIKDENWELLGVKKEMFDGVRFASKHEKVSAAIAALFEAGTHYNSDVTEGFKKAIDLKDPYYERRTGIGGAIGGFLGGAAGLAAGVGATALTKGGAALKAGGLVTTGATAGTELGRGIMSWVTGEAKVDKSMVKDPENAEAMALTLMELAKDDGKGDQYSLKDEWGRQFLGQVGNSAHNAIWATAEFVFKLPETGIKIVNGELFKLIEGQSPYRLAPFKTSEWAEAQAKPLMDFYSILDPELGDRLKWSKSGALNTTASIVGGLMSMGAFSATMKGLSFGLTKSFQFLGNTITKTANAKAASAFAKGMSSARSAKAYAQSMKLAAEELTQVYTAANAPKQAAAVVKATEKAFNQLGELYKKGKIADVAKAEKVINNYFTKLGKIPQGLSPSHANFTATLLESTAAARFRSILGGGKTFKNLEALENNMGYMKKIISNISQAGRSYSIESLANQNLRYLAGFMDGAQGAKPLTWFFQREAQGITIMNPRLLGFSLFRDLVVDERAPGFDKIATDTVIDVAFAMIGGMGGKFLNRAKYGKAQPGYKAPTPPREHAFVFADTVNQGAKYATGGDNLTQQEYWNSVNTEVRNRIMTKIEDDNYIPHYKEFNETRPKESHQLGVEVSTILNTINSADDIKIATERVEQSFEKRGLPISEARDVVKQWTHNIDYISEGRFYGSNKRVGTPLSEIDKTVDANFARYSGRDGGSVDPMYRRRAKNFEITTALYVHSVKTELKKNAVDMVTHAEQAGLVKFGSKLKVDEQPFEAMLKAEKSNDRPQGAKATQEVHDGKQPEQFKVKYGNKNTTDYKNLKAMGDGTHQVTFKETTFNGEPAVQIMNGKKRVGYIPKEMAKELTGNVPKKGIVSIKGGSVTFKFHDFKDPIKVKIKKASPTLAKQLGSKGVVEAPLTRELISELEGATGREGTPEFGKDFATDRAIIRNRVLGGKGIIAANREHRKTQGNVVHVDEHGKRTTDIAESRVEAANFRKAAYDQVSQWAKDFTEEHGGDLATRLSYARSLGAAKKKVDPEFEAYFKEKFYEYFTPHFENLAKDRALDVTSYNNPNIKKFKELYAKDYYENFGFTDEVMKQVEVQPEIPEAVKDFKPHKVGTLADETKKKIRKLNSEKLETLDLIHKVYEVQNNAPAKDLIKEQPDDFKMAVAETKKLVKKLPEDEVLRRINLEDYDPTGDSEPGVTGKLNRARLARLTLEEYQSAVKAHRELNRELRAEGKPEVEFDQQAVVDGIIKNLDLASVDSALEAGVDLKGKKIDPNKLKSYRRAYRNSPESFVLKDLQISKQEKVGEAIGEFVKNLADASSKMEKSYSKTYVEDRLAKHEKITEKLYDQLNNYVEEGKGKEVLVHPVANAKNWREYMGADPELPLPESLKKIFALNEAGNKLERIHRASINAHNNLEVLATGEAKNRMESLSRHIKDKDGNIRKTKRIGKFGENEAVTKVMTDMEWRAMGAEAAGKAQMFASFIEDKLNKGEYQKATNESRQLVEANAAYMDEDGAKDQIGSSIKKAVNHNDMAALALDLGVFKDGSALAEKVKIEAKGADENLTKSREGAEEDVSNYNPASEVSPEYLEQYYVAKITSELAYKRAKGEDLSPEDKVLLKELEEFTNKNLERIPKQLEENSRDVLRAESGVYGVTWKERENGRIVPVLSIAQGKPGFTMDRVRDAQPGIAYNWQTEPKIDFLRAYDLIGDRPTKVDTILDNPDKHHRDVETGAQYAKDKPLGAEVFDEVTPVEELDYSQYVLLNKAEKNKFSRVDERFRTDEPVKVNPQMYQWLEMMTYAHKTHEPNLAIKASHGLQQFLLTTGFRSMNAYQTYANLQAVYAMPSLTPVIIKDFVGQMFDRFYVGKTFNKSKEQLMITEMDATGNTKFATDLHDVRAEAAKAPRLISAEYLQRFNPKNLVDNYLKAYGGGKDAGGRTELEAVGHMTVDFLSSISDERVFGQYIPMVKYRMVNNIVSKQMRKAGISLEPGVSKNPAFQQAVREASLKVDAMFNPAQHGKRFRNKEILRDGLDINPTHNPHLEFYGQHKTSQAMIENSSSLGKAQGTIDRIVKAVFFAPSHFAKIAGIPIYAVKGVVNDKFRLYTKMALSMTAVALFTSLMSAEEDDLRNPEAFAEKVMKDAGKIFFQKQNNSEIYVDMFAPFRHPFKVGSDVVSGQTTLSNAVVNRMVAPLRALVQAGTNKGYFDQAVILDENKNPISYENDPVKYYSAMVGFVLKQSFSHGYLTAAQKVIDVDKDGKVTFKDDAQSLSAFILDAVDAPVKFKDLDKQAKGELFHMSDRIIKYAKSLNFNPFSDETGVQKQKQKEVLDFAIKQANIWNKRWNAFGRDTERAELAANVLTSALLSPKNAAAQVMEQGYNESFEATDLVHARNALRNKVRKMMKERGLEMEYAPKHKKQIEKYEAHADYSQFVQDFKTGATKFELDKAYKKMNEARKIGYLHKDYGLVENLEAEYVDVLHNMFLDLASKYGDEFVNDNMWRIIKNNDISKYFVVPQKAKVEFRKKNKLGPWSTKQLHPVDYYNDKWGLKASKFKASKDEKQKEKTIIDGWTVGIDGQVEVKTHKSVDKSLAEIKDDLKKGKVGRARIKMRKLSSPRVYKTYDQINQLNQYVLSQGIK